MEKMPGKAWFKRPCVIKMTEFNGRKMFVHFPECLLTGSCLCVIFNKKIQKICSGPPFFVRLCSFFWTSFWSTEGPLFHILYHQDGTKPLWLAFAGNGTKGFASPGFEVAVDPLLPYIVNVPKRMGDAYTEDAMCHGKAGLRWLAFPSKGSKTC